jgi:thermitase
MKKCESKTIVVGVLSVVLLALWALLPAVAHTGQKEMKVPPSLGGIKPGDFLPCQVVVYVKTQDAKKGILQVARAVGAQILHENTRLDMFLFSFTNDTDAEAAIKHINKKYGGLLLAERNWKMGIPPTPKAPIKAQSDKFLPQHATNDPGAKASWWLEKIKEPYSGTPLAADKNIAIIDTGVDYTHSELEGKVISVFDYVNWDTDAMDEHGHGTHCAGIAAAKAGNASGIHGVSPNSKIYAYRVLDASGSGGSYQIQTAITDAADNANVSILSLSLGGYATAGSASYTAWQTAVNYARTTKGKVVCVAAGNEYDFYMIYYPYYGTQYRVVPGYIAQAFTVGASDQVDFRAEFSNHDLNRASGDGTITYNLSFVDIVAPGCDILSTLPGERYDSWDGTSMATPMVAGACARVWGKNPAFTAAQVETKLAATGKSVGAALGWPVAEKRIDLMKALGATATGLQGIVYQGESAFPVYNVKVEAHTGSGTGPLVKTVYTNKAGVFTFTGLTGGTNYYLKMIKTGFITLTSTAVAATAGSINDIGTPYFLVPNRASTATDQNWRIIATWKDGQPGLYDWSEGYDWGGETTYWPFWYYQSAGFEGNAYLQDPDGYVYYWDNTGALGIDPYVGYLYDSYNGTPLECHVIQQPKTGVYSYVLSADPDDFCWGAIKYGAGKTPIYASNAVVKVYKGNTLKATINSSAATRVGTGTMYWHVFTLNTSSGAVTVVNKITDTAPFGLY